MTPLARLALLVVALLVSGFSFGFAPVRADELPADTNKIESLTPEQARKLATEFPGVDVDIEIKAYGKCRYDNCLPLNGLKSLNAETARALAGYGKGPLFLDGLTTLDADTAKGLEDFKGMVILPDKVLETLFADNPLTSETALAWAVVSNGNLSHVTALDAPDSIAIARALATRKGPLALPNLKKISPKTLSALIEKEDVEIPLLETLELIQEPDGSPTEDFVIPDWLEDRQKHQPRWQPD